MRISDWISDVCSSDRRRRGTARAPLPGIVFLRDRVDARLEPAGVAKRKRRVHPVVLLIERLVGPVVPQALQRPVHPVAPVGVVLSQPDRHHVLEEGLADREPLGSLARSEEHTYELQSLMRNSYAV